VKSLLGIQQMIDSEPAHDQDMQRHNREHHRRAPDAERHQDAHRDIDGFYHHGAS
jgi:hypothetical protein